MDLCLLARPESRYPNPFDILFELELVRRKTLGKKGRELREMDEAALRQLPAVRTALAEARGQVERYRDALVRQRCVGPPPGGRGAVIALAVRPARSEPFARGLRGGNLKRRP